MSLTSLQEIWNKHVNGSSAKAAKAATDVLRGINFQDFSNLSVATIFGDTSRIVEVTGVSAAKKEEATIGKVYMDQNLHS